MRSFLICTFLIYLMPCAVTSKAIAQLKVLEGNQISFGKVYQTGEKVNEVLTLENTGNKNITIKNVHTSCGCTVASMSDSLIHPGEKTTVRIEFNPTGYIGEVTKYIYIMTSDTANQMMTVIMNGYVAYALQPTPGYVAFYHSSLGKLDSTNVTLSNTSDETMQITKVELPFEELTYKLSKKTLKPGEFADLELYMNSKKVENLNGNIRIYTTSKLQPVLQMKIFAGVIGR